jgi:hypothetical protein
MESWIGFCDARVALGRGELTAKMNPIREPLTPVAVLSP